MAAVTAGAAGFGLTPWFCATLVASAYHKCPTMDLAKQQIRFDYKPRLRLEYKPRPLKQHDEPDIPCFGEIILQIDTVKQLTEEPRAQRRHHPPRKRDTS